MLTGTLALPSSSNVLLSKTRRNVPLSWKRKNINMIRLCFNKRKVDSPCTNCKLLLSSKAGWVHRVAYFQTMQLFNCPSQNSFATRITLPQLCAVPADRLNQTAADQFNFSFNYSSSDLLRVFADVLCFLAFCCDTLCNICSWGAV